MRTTIRTFPTAKRDSVLISTVSCSSVLTKRSKNSTRKKAALCQFIKLIHMAHGDPKSHSLASTLTTSRTPTPASVVRSIQPFSAIRVALTTSQFIFSRTPSSLMSMTKLSPTSVTHIPRGLGRINAWNGHAQRQRTSSSSSKTPPMEAVSGRSKQFQASRSFQTSRMPSEGTLAAR